MLTLRGNGYEVAIVNSREMTVDSFFWRHPYQDITLLGGSAWLIVSGRTSSGGYGLARILASDQNQVEAFDMAAFGVPVVRAAAEIGGGTIAFVGATGEGAPYQFYL
ncbi:MAG: hypothetical protein HC915_02300 [Anaerolineae bacterium]|nr:hypothetical protein [Anaerolineae bacterium]